MTQAKKTQANSVNDHKLSQAQSDKAAISGLDNKQDSACPIKEPIQIMYMMGTCLDNIFKSMSILGDDLEYVTNIMNNNVKSSCAINDKMHNMVNDFYSENMKIAQDFFKCSNMVDLVTLQERLFNSNSKTLMQDISEIYNMVIDMGNNSSARLIDMIGKNISLAEQLVCNNKEAKK